MTDMEQISRNGVMLTGLRAGEAGLIFREQPTSDFGIDAQFEVKEGSTATGRLIAAQIKAGGSQFADETERGFLHYISDRHKNLWINHSLPVLVVLCDLESSVCYYEVVTDQTCLPTEGRWKMLIPKNKILDAAHLSDLISIASPIAAASDSTVCAEQDVSHAGVKRISLDIVAHAREKSLNKPLLGAIVRKALRAGQESEYSRDEIAARALAGRTADVVWGYVYLREIDRESASWVCRFQWISNSLAEAFRPTIFPGEQDGSGLVIDWKANTELPKLLDGRRATKRDYLAGVDHLLAHLPDIEMALGATIVSEDQNAIDTKLESMSKAFEDMWDDRFAAPLECQRLNQAIRELLATVGNAGLIWGQRNSRDWKNMRPLLTGYQNDLTRLSGEISFLRRDVC